MATQAQLSLFSPAKINLFLRIVGKRPDGFHELETIMAALDFGDTLTFKASDTGIALTCDNPILPTDDKNLVVRAAKMLAKQFSATRGVAIDLVKRAPLAAGLGGGSSNAAFTLLGLNQFWKLGATSSQLGEIAAQLGSDVNFFLDANTGLCRGRGEQVEAIPSHLAATVLLVNPGFGISTKWAYESWAKAAGQLTAKPLPVNLLTDALVKSDLGGVSQALFNSLEAPSVGKFPVLALIKNAMRAQGATGALMSGSGSTLFGLFAEASAAEKCAMSIRAEFGPSMWTQVTKLRISDVTAR